MILENINDAIYLVKANIVKQNIFYLHPLLLFLKTV
jgi:hypothetical protein